MAEKKRLDTIVQQQYPDLSKTLIQSLIMQGKVSIEGNIITKPGTQVRCDSVIKLDLEMPKYVSRAGFKLEHALHYFSIDVTGLTALDAGLSTGGFTDCLLQHGANKVYGIDVGYGQVHEKIRSNPHVVVMERTNLRTLASLPELVDFVTLDLSFISVLKVLTAVKQHLKSDGKLMVLIKPQFEAEKGQVGRGGIVRDDKIRELIVQRVIAGIKEAGFEFIGLTESPILGADGNKEYLGYFKKILLLLNYLVND